MSFLSSAEGAPPGGPVVGESSAGPDPVDGFASIGTGFDRALEQDSDLRLFAGANAAAFARLSAAPRAGWSAVCWPGLAVPAIWFLYRKMYGWAALVVLGPVVASLAHLPGSLVQGAALAASLLGAFGNRLYLARARRMIAEIRAAAADEAAARATIARAGGVSVAGGIVGALLVGAFLALAFLKP
jgi:hypothetical protein